MIMIVEIIILIIMLYIAICITYNYYKKQYEELENRILQLENRINEYNRNSYNRDADLNKQISIINENIYELSSALIDLRKKVKKNEK